MLSKSKFLKFMLALVLMAAWTATFPVLGGHADDSARQVRSQKIRSFYNDLNKNTMHLVDDFYSEAVLFEDPVGKLEGRGKVRRYYEKMYESATSIRFDILDEIVQGDTHVAVWKMTMTAKKLNRGKPVVLDGNSVIRFNADNKAIYHRDYFDMGQFIYEHIPVLKQLIRAIKKNFTVEK